MFKNIVFFRYKLLSEQLRNNQVDELLAVKYLIFSAVITGSVIRIPIEITPDFIEFAKLNLFLSICELIIFGIINVIGIWYLYQANGQGDGKDFFKRIVCLNFPVSLTILIVYGIPVYLLLEIITMSNPMANKFSELTWLAFLEIQYYRINYSCLLDISGTGIPNKI